MEIAYEQLEKLPKEEADRRAEEILEYLLHERREMSVEELSERFDSSWQTVWILSMLLADAGYVTVRGVANRAAYVKPNVDTIPNPRVDSNGAWAKLIGRSLPPITYIERLVFGEGSTVIGGDQNNIVGSNTVGAVGRENLVGKVESQYSDTGPVTIDKIMEVVDTVAKQLMDRESQELRDAAREFQLAGDAASRRQGLQRLMGIASFLGPVAAPLLQIVRLYVEGNAGQ
ncbi:hypothetical protein [Cryptosporangium sp. NPDC051539]|uniref:hypothetical protein n=1 Tax=Cryptosporangium sp. NPDC051539 TaxID=3363962 RepID=UPI0037B20723